MRKTACFSGGLATVLAGTEIGLVLALRVARERNIEWPSIMMAALAAVLLAGGVLRHYIDMFKTRSDAGISLKFALLDVSGDVASLVSVIFQSTLKIYGLVIYGSELAIWLGLMGIVLYFRTLSQNRAAGEHTV